MAYSKEKLDRPKTVLFESNEGEISMKKDFKISIFCEQCNSPLNIDGKCPKCGRKYNIGDYFPEIAGTTLLKKAIAGDVDAMLEIGLAYYKSKSGDSNTRRMKAKYWCERSARGGCIKAWAPFLSLCQLDYRLCYDEFQQIKLLADAYDVALEGSYAGNSVCLLNIQNYLFEGMDGYETDVKQGMSILTSLAEGPSEYDTTDIAMYQMGEILFLGKYGVKKDYSRAFCYFERLYGLRNKEDPKVGAAYYMARCYENGLGVEKDFDKAVELYEVAVSDPEIDIPPAKEFLKKYCKEKEEKELKEYWDNHPEEKARIENEKHQHLEDINGLKKHIDELSENIKSLQSKRNAKTPLEKQLDEEKNKLVVLNKKLKEISFFKFKDRAAVKKEIDSQNKVFDEIADKARSERQSFNNEIDKEINGINESIAELNKKIQELKEKIKKLDNYNPLQSKK